MVTHRVEVGHDVLQFVGNVFIEFTSATKPQTAPLGAEQSVLDRIQRRQLKWYGHLLTMEDSRWPKKIYQWTPYGRRRRGIFLSCRPFVVITTFSTGLVGVEVTSFSWLGQLTVGKSLLL